MENISIKLEEAIARQIDRKMADFNYSTKTEFIRDAIRGKLKELDEEASRKKAWHALYATRGVLKGKGKAQTDEEFRKLTEEAGEKYIEMLEKKLAQK